jgi:hypothetical protein
LSESYEQEGNAVALAIGERERERESHGVKKVLV